ncbi:MAG: ANTAR domain-containing protein [Comamonadaceae bacterium]|nr:MAG: ANTAR domain-containing protein [Comamonadaceae bacterium]
MKSGLSFLIAARRCEISELEQLTRTSALVNVVGRMVHGLQKERGISNGFLGSRGQQFKAQLSQQVEDCLLAEQELRAGFETLDTEAGHLGNGARLFSRIAFVLHELDGLPGLRGRVHAMKLTPLEATAGFVKLIAGLLAVVFEAADAATNPEISRQLVAMFNFMQGKEFAGQERAFGSATFASGRIDAPQQQQWLHLIQSQERCMQVFGDFATPTLSEVWQDCQSPATLAELERLRRVGCSVATGTLDPNLSQVWFDCCTRRIDAMKSVEDQLAGELLMLCNHKITQARAELHDHQVIMAALTEQAAISPGAPDRPAPGTTPYGPHLERSILDLVHEQASRLQAMSDELETVRASLNERKLVERAKGLLMAHRKLSEEEAYKMLRQTAMNQNKRITDVAEAVLAMSEYL